jgi:hypothetical protein
MMATFAVLQRAEDHLRQRADDVHQHHAVVEEISDGPLSR